MTTSSYQHSLRSHPLDNDTARGGFIYWLDAQGQGLTLPSTPHFSIPWTTTSIPSNGTLYSVTRSNSAATNSPGHDPENRTGYNRINVVLLGNTEELNFGRDPLYFTITSITFRGHMSYSMPAFKMCSQLKELKSVKFLIGGEYQLDFFRETDEGNISKPPRNESVIALKVCVDVECFKVYSNERKFMIENLVESVLKYSSESFPNLRKLDLELPSGGLLHEVVNGVLSSWKHLKSGTEITVNSSRIIVSSKLRRAVHHPSPSLSVHAWRPHCEDYFERPTFRTATH